MVNFPSLTVSFTLWHEPLQTLTMSWGKTHCDMGSHGQSWTHNAVYWAQKDNIHDISIWSPNDVPFQELDQLLGDQIWWNHQISQFPPDFPLTQPIVPSFRAAFESRGVNSGGRQLSACLVLLRGASIFPLGMRIPDDCYVLHGLSTLPTIVTRSWASWGRAVVGFGDFEFCPSQCLSGKKLWARRFLWCHVISLWYPNISASKVVVKSPFPVERAYFTGMSPQGNLPAFGQASQPVEKTGPTLPLQKRENVAWCVTWLYGSMKSLAWKPPKTI